jgi:hypothetical protein
MVIFTILTPNKTHRHEDQLQWCQPDEQVSQFISNGRVTSDRPAVSKSKAESGWLQTKDFNLTLMCSDQTVTNVQIKGLKIGLLFSTFDMPCYYILFCQKNKQTLEKSCL